MCATKTWMGYLYMHVHTCRPRFRISGTAGRIVLKFGAWLWTSYQSMHFMHTTSGLYSYLHVLTFSPFFHIPVSTGRIMLKFGVLLDSLTMRFSQAMNRISTFMQVQLNIRFKHIRWLPFVHRPEDLMLVALNPTDCTGHNL